jgi:hypothetical protein
MQETAIAAKMKAAGVVPIEIEARAFVAKWMNNGGSAERLMAIVAECYGKDRYEFAGRTLQERRVQIEKGSGEGLRSSADKAVQWTPPLSHTNSSAGLRTSADKAGDLLPAAATPRDGEGLMHHADKADVAVPPVSIRRMPGHAKRGAAAVAAAQEPMRRSLFDTYRLPGDARAIGDITWKELQGLARRHAEAYRLLSLIDGYGVPPDPDMPVREVLKEDTLREFVEIARLSNVH